MPNITKRKNICKQLEFTVEKLSLKDIPFGCFLFRAIAFFTEYSNKSKMSILCLTICLDTKDLANPRLCLISWYLSVPFLF